MCWIKWDPLTPNDIITAAAVPISIWGSWFIFKAGKNSEIRKRQQDFVIAEACKCLELSVSLQESATKYFTSSPANPECAALEFEISTGIKRLGRDLKELEIWGKESKDFFGVAYLEFKEAMTGSQVQFQYSNRAALAANSQPLTDIADKQNVLHLLVAKVREKALKGKC